MSERHDTATTATSNLKMTNNQLYYSPSKDVIDKGVHDAHALFRNSGIRMDLLEHLVDVRAVGSGCDDAVQKERRRRRRRERDDDDHSESTKNNRNRNSHHPKKELTYL